MAASRRRKLSTTTYFAVLAVLVVLIIALWIVAPVLAIKLLAYYDLEKSVSTLGPFGDIYGALNALFSGLAFAALITALLFQQAEIRDQREEMEETREVFEKQNFESTFFSMLRLYREIVDGMLIHSQDERSPGRSLRGRSVLRELYRMFKDELHRGYAVAMLDDPNDLLKVVGDRYVKFQADCESQLGHYYRTLYNILKFIARSDVEDKRLYTNLVRAQLNSDELKLLFFNCLSPIGYEKFKPLVEEFTILESVVDDEVINARTRALYAPSAFTR